MTFKFKGQGLNVNSLKSRYLANSRRRLSHFICIPRYLSLGIKYHMTFKVSDQGHDANLILE